MATVKQVQGTRTALTIAALATLASATFCASSAYNCTTNQPLDVIVEVDVATTNTPAGNKQVVVYIQESLDGSNYRSGPTSGTSLTDQPNLKYLGTVPINSSSVTERATFSILQALGYVPQYFQIVCLNDLGVALTSGSAYTAEISATVA